MNIDSDLLVGLSLGQPTRIIEPGDTQIHVSPVLITTVPSSLPVHFAPSGLTPLTVSGVVDSVINRVNQAGIFTQILTLNPGYWEIDVTMTSFFNWTHAVGSNVDADVYMQIGTEDFFLVSRYAAIGSHVNQANFRLLARDVVTVWHEVGPTGVGQNSDTTVLVSANKLL